ncbi:hypothetical protein Btru_026075 [Bulinus truncatus]|nr:hypothetical protein Btru_026075 [Bulinus truncatus]
MFDLKTLTLCVIVSFAFTDAIVAPQCRIGCPPGTRLADNECKCVPNVCRPVLCKLGCPDGFKKTSTAVSRSFHIPVDRKDLDITKLNQTSLDKTHSMNSSDESLAIHCFNCLWAERQKSDQFKEKTTT